MAAEDIHVKTVRQVIPSSGLWFRYDESREGIGESFLPIIAIAHLEIEPPDPTYFTDSFLIPIESEELVYGLIERWPFEGMRFTYTIYHEADFEEVGVRLKPEARPRSVVSIPEGTVSNLANKRLEHEQCYMTESKFEHVKSVRQIIPSSRLWLRYDEVREDISKPFLPVVAIAHLEIESPHPTYFTDSFLMPVTSEGLMYELIERRPVEGMRSTYTIYHEVDFEEVGVRLKLGVRPRRVVGVPEETQRPPQ